MEIQELMERYGLSSRQSLYARLKALGITLEKGERKKVYATDEQILLLDDLDRHIKDGGSLKTFLPPIETVLVSDGEPVESIKLLPQPNSMEMLERLVGAIASNIQARSPLWYHYELEKAATSGWHLTTNEIRELIGVKPICKKDSVGFQRGCWLFTKAGKIGNQCAWKVNQVDVDKTGLNVIP